MGEYFVTEVLNRPSKTAFLALGTPLSHADDHKQLVARVEYEDGTHSTSPANTPTEGVGQCMTNTMPADAARHHLGLLSGSVDDLGVDGVR
jgi:hypothetical protein